MRSTIGQGPALKSRLLVGAAGMAFVSTAAMAADDAPPAPSAPPPAPNTWSAYGSIGGGLGDGFAQGRVDIFVPAWQNLDSLLFVNLGVGTATRQDVFSGVNIGYRTKVSPEWILGGYVGFDASQADDSHTFHQYTAGAEAMSADWDARINGYLAGKGVAANGHYQLAIQDTSIAILQSQTAGFSGFDGEVGYRVFNTDNTDVRLFVGGFSFTHHDDFRYRDMSGPMARAEVNIFDLDELGPQSRISLQAEISHDSVRKTSGFVGANLRIALGDSSGGGAQALSDLDRRLVDPVRRRDNVLTATEYNKPEPVIIYGSHLRSNPTNSLYYVDNSQGAGSYSDPTTLNDAATRGRGQNAFIVATDFEGAVTTGGAKLGRGETLVGGGETFTVKGVNSGVTFTHAFAPGSGRPTLTAGSAKTNAIGLSSNTSVYGLDIAGPFKDAIFGHNVNNVSIGDVSIDGSSGGTNGIVITQTRSANSNVAIADSAISHVSGDGIDVIAKITDGGSSKDSLAITGTRISDAGGYAINVSSYAGGATTSFDQMIDIRNVHASSTGHVGVHLAGTAGTGASFSQVAEIDPTTISGSYYGLLVEGSATGGAHMHQNISLNDVTASGSLAAVSIYGSAEASGVLHQSISMDGVTVKGALFGVGVVGYAGAGGKTFQTIDAKHLNASNNSGYGLYIGGTANGSSGAALLAQYISVENSTFDGNGVGGAALILSSSGDAAALQQIALSDSSFDNNGIGLVSSVLADYGSSAQQYGVLLNDSMTGNAGSGALLAAYGLDQGFASQTFTIYGNAKHAFEISGNGGAGLTVRGWALYGGNVEQNTNIYYADISRNKGDGVYVDTLAAGYRKGAYAYYYGQVTSNVFAAYDTFNHNGGSGVHVDNLTQAGGQLNQFVEVYGSNANHNTADGVFEHSVANAYLYPGSVYELKTQLYSDIYVVNSHADRNRANGIEANSAGYGYAYMLQHVYVSNTTANNNHHNGISVDAYARGAYSANIEYVTLLGSTFDNNHRDGANITAEQYFGPQSFGATLQYVTVQGSDFSYNGHDGFAAVADASGSQGRVGQQITISGSRFDNNASDGISLYRHSHDGVYVPPTTVGSVTYGGGCYLPQALYGQCTIIRQVVNIQDSDVSNNGQDGLYLHTVADNYGSVYDASGRPNEPTMLIVNSHFDGNGNDGLDIVNNVSNNSYLFQFVYTYGSTFSHNAHNGITLANTLSNFGIINTSPALAYSGSYTPQLFVRDSVASHNGNDGLSTTTHATSSAIYQYNLLLDSQFDHNGVDGVNSYVSGTLGSLSIQKFVAYSYQTGVSASRNGVNGIYVQNVSDGSLYSYGAGLTQIIGSSSVQGDFSHNTRAGIEIYDTGLIGLNAIYNNTFSNNKYGIALADVGAVQISYVGGNSITNNTDGVAMVNLGGIQATSIYYRNGDPTKPMGNTFSGNGTDVYTLNIGGLQFVY
ncbi:MAG TPA: hypothetical protein VHW02_11360 [Rhizomicrobium sp.]|nr:hypothetical protein [Rhizomicrobium sp.]